MENAYFTAFWKIYYLSGTLPFVSPFDSYNHCICFIPIFVIFFLISHPFSKTKAVFINDTKSLTYVICFTNEQPLNFETIFNFHTKPHFIIDLPAQRMNFVSLCCCLVTNFPYSSFCLN